MAEADAVIRLAASDALTWRDWDDGCVVFNRVTGETHYLDLFTSYLLRLIAASPLTEAALTETVQGDLGDAESGAFGGRIGTALRNFEALALIARRS